MHPNLEDIKEANGTSLSANKRPKRWLRQIGSHGKSKEREKSNKGEWVEWWVV
jgi:hypothetical protein